MKRWRILASIVLVAGLTGVVGLHPVQAQSSRFVNIQANSYSPAVVTVEMGDDVSWINFDSVDHTATSDTGAWDTGTINGAQSVNGIAITSGSDAIVFNESGTFPYHDRLNPSIHGTIIVQAAGVTPTATPTLLPPTATSEPTMSAAPTSTPSSTATSTAIPTAMATPTSTPSPIPSQLQISTSGALHAGHATTLRVAVHERAGGAQVVGAVVALDGRKIGIKIITRGTTNNRGVAVFKAVHPRVVGVIRIVATKQGFLTGSVNVRVRP